MRPDAVTVAALVILLFPMGYFLLASPAFLLVKLDIPPVTQLLRGMFNIQFRMISVTGVIGTAAFIFAGRPLFAAGIGLITALAIWGRRGSCARWTTSSVREMRATRTRCASYDVCIGAECCVTRRWSPLSWPAFPTLPQRRERIARPASATRDEPQRDACLILVHGNSALLPLVDRGRHHAEIFPEHAAEMR